MQFPEKEIFEALQEQLTSKGNYLTGEGHPEIAHIDLDRAQYEPKEEATEFPFPRPAVFINFGDMKYEHDGKRQRGTIPLTVTVVQDKYVDSMEGSASQDEFLKLLEWKYLIHDILTSMEASCFTNLFLIGIKTDSENRNLHVETIEYECKVTLKRTLVP